MEKQFKRGIHDEILLNSLKKNKDQEGKLYPLIELVRNSKELVLQIRDNYFNIYYLGGNVAEVESLNRVKFDKNYFRKCENKNDEDWDAIKSNNEEAKNLFKAGKFAEYVEKNVLPRMEKMIYSLENRIGRQMFKLIVESAKICRILFAF